MSDQIRENSRKDTKALSLLLQSVHCSDNTVFH